MTTETDRSQELTHKQLLTLDSVRSAGNKAYDYYGNHWTWDNARLLWVPVKPL